MQQYFVEEVEGDGDQLVLSGEDGRHIIKVMRMRVGDEVSIVRNQATAAFYEITAVDDKAQLVYVQKKADDKTKRELPIEVTVVLGLLKSDKFDYAVQKLTELGVTTIIPWQAARSVVKVDDRNAEKKRTRWQSIAKEAAEQSKRLRIPVIARPQDLSMILSDQPEAGYIYVAYEALAAQAAVQSIELSVETKQLTFIIGPEGGITDEEVTLLEAAQEAKGIRFISLGNRILRAETAAIFAMSLVAGKSEHII